MEDFLIAYANFFYLGAVGTERFRVLKNPTAETQIERNRKRWGNRKSVCGRAVNSLVSPMTRPQRFPVPDLRGKWRRARSADGGAPQSLRFQGKKMEAPQELLDWPTAKRKRKRGGRPVR